jgi:EmrB/QacA subfamily drug resistance transporter
VTLRSQKMTAAGGETARQPSWTLLTLVAVAQFMVILDMTVANMALPSIGRSLHLGLADLQWVLTAYVLVTGGLTLVGGRASDLLGRRATFLTGLAVFTLASLTSGLAPDAGTLIASRAAQGLGAALLTPSALAIITATYTGSRRATALGLWGGMAGGGAAAGVLIGGALTTWAGWRWVFLINIPVGIVVGALAPRLIGGGGRADGHGGGGLLTAPLAIAGLASAVYAITRASQHDWLIPLLASLALLAAFTLAERRAAHPLIPRGMLRSPSLIAGTTLMLASSGVIVGVFYLGSLYLQGVLRASPALAGAEFLPLLVTIGAGTHLTGRLASRTGTRPLATAGLALMTGGALWLSRATGYPAGILPAFVILGAGIGLVFPSASVTAMSRVDHRQAGAASGLLSTGHEIGAALGVAVVTAIATVTANGAIGGTGFAAGYRDALTVVAAVAAGLTVLVALALPSARPAPGVRVAAH